MIKELISFDLCGKMAHFRKYYSSSSALSYTIPPKTTIIGLIAGMLGLERDSYYDKFDNWFVGVQVISPVRKIFQKMNYLKVEKSMNISLENNNFEITGVNSRTQIAVELLLPENIRTDVIKYRIFLGVKDKNDLFFSQLKKCLSRNRFEYGVALGTANMIGYFENYKSEYTFSAIDKEEILLSTACRTDTVEYLRNDEEGFLIEQDTFPLRMQIRERNEKKNFATRIAKEVKALIYPLNKNGMRVRISNPDNFLKIDSETTFYISLL